MPDWEAIRKEYEQGKASVRTLAATYDVPKTTILRRIQQEQWTKTPVVQIAVHSGPLDQEGLAAPLAQDMISQLATIAKIPLDLKEHQLFAQALSQYNKILLTAPVNQDLPKGIDWSIFEQAELDIIQPIFAAAEERKRIADGESGIPQLGRKTV